MTNRKLAYIIKDQKPLVLSTSETVQQACRHMGSVASDPRSLSTISGASPAFSPAAMRCACWRKATMQRKRRLLGR